MNLYEKSDDARKPTKFRILKSDHTHEMLLITFMLSYTLLLFQSGQLQLFLQKSFFMILPGFCFLQVMRYATFNSLIDLLNLLEHIIVRVTRLILICILILDLVWWTQLNLLWLLILSKIFVCSIIQDNSFQMHLWLTLFINLIVFVQLIVV